MARLRLGEALLTRGMSRFIEGDRIRSASNVAKMAAGIALDDAVRWPWLDRVACELFSSDPDRGGVISCSALPRSYRDLLRSSVGRCSCSWTRKCHEKSFGDVWPLGRGITYPPTFDSQVSTREPSSSEELGVRDGQRGA
ncbi:MAG: hypothetical protein EOO38_13770 [Cytophagaceae bacterium]|nr:MAG: hypothetical protein EOO38_13770 [Cytophagaceae bacterium]